MSIKRYIATADTSITNAFRENLQTRGTGSNMGASDVLETFSIYGQSTSSSVERMRILAKFPVDTISSDRSAGTIPASGSVSFYIKLSNAPHGETLPRDFDLIVAAVSRSWEEGTGLDMEEFTDITRDNVGANWENAGSATAWTNEGGDYLTGSYVAGSSMPHYTASFDDGTEDLELDATAMVEEWLDSTHPNYGVGIFLPASLEAATRSYYTKRFFARGSEFFYARPWIEARWDSSRKDNRGNFLVSSSLLALADNTNTLYLYNYVNGQLKDIPNITSGNPIFVSLHTATTGGEQLTASAMPVTGGWVSTGIYSASFSLYTTSSVVYDKWFSGSTYYHTGSFEPITHTASEAVYTTRKYITSITNLRPIYRNDETTRFRVFSRLKDLQTTIYNIATTQPEVSIIEDAYYSVYRVADKQPVISYGTGSLNQTRLSYDETGNYFDLDMSLFEPGFMYAIKLAYYINGDYEEQPESWRFRVESI